MLASRTVRKTVQHHLEVFGSHFLPGTGPTERLALSAVAKGPLEAQLLA